MSISKPLNLMLRSVHRLGRLIEGMVHVKPESNDASAHILDEEMVILNDRYEELRRQWKE